MIILHVGVLIGIFGILKIAQKLEKNKVENVLEPISETECIREKIKFEKEEGWTTDMESDNHDDTDSAEEELTTDRDLDNLCNEEDKSAQHFVFLV